MRANGNGNGGGHHHDHGGGGDAGVDPGPLARALFAALKRSAEAQVSFTEQAIADLTTRTHDDAMATAAVVAEAVSDMLRRTAELIEQLERLAQRVAKLESAGGDASGEGRE
jgi:hypothetical protein